MHPEIFPSFIQISFFLLLRLLRDINLMSIKETREPVALDDSRIASTEPTITGSAYDNEKVIGMENAPSSPAADAGAATEEPLEDPNAPVKPTGIKLALIFVGYVSID